ncbi:hypothetical protein K435DRAFT_868097 [Dendrothele bispora CBS 962.96]|uniref:Uncharacterized protein n=1 Tax=Dendrothele bispora (strain CBS 962.96) TaxID=1314807 RepID=A0A4S8LCI9_DENBC|nr:hypothetical protein K435DRAFT_868097 [Dendrothele bispora CBS 962.96]
MASPVETRSSSPQVRINITIILDRTFLVESIVYALLPAVERSLLNMELECAPKSTLTGPMTSTTTTMTTNERGTHDIVMSLSWEDARTLPPGPTPAVCGPRRPTSSSLTNSVLENRSLAWSTSSSTEPPIIPSSSLSASISASASTRKSTRKLTTSMGENVEHHQREQLKRSVPGSTFDNEEDQDGWEGCSIGRSGVVNQRGVGKHRAIEEYGDNGKEEFEENWFWFWFGRWVRYH